MDSLNTDVINLKLHKDGDSSVMGEIKIVGSHDGAFYNDQNMAVQLISYVIAHMFSVSKRIKTAEEIGLRATEIAKTLELNLNNNIRELTIEKATSTTLKNRLTSVLSLVVLIGQCLESASIGSIANIMNETLPAITGCKSAGLLVLETTSNNSLHFSVVAPDGSKKGTISYDQLLQIPSFKDNPMAYQSKIMIGQTGVRALGAILLFRNIEESTDSLGIAREKSAWSGLEDILVGSLNAALINCMTKFAYSDLIDQLRKESNHAIQILDQNKRENIKLLEQKSTNELTLSKFEHEIMGLTETLKLNEEMHRNVTSSLNERIATLEVDLAEAIKQNAMQVSCRHDLTALVMSYSFDHRSHHDAVYQWLTDFASSRNTKVYSVAQEEGGTLAANSASIIRGIVAAAGEALRTNNLVEIFTNYAGNNDTNNKFMLSSNATCNVVALIVPNRFASPQSQSQSRHDHACFVFTRSCKDKNDGFTTYDKEIFSAASALAARSLFHSKTKHSVDDIVSLEEKLMSLKNHNLRSKQVISTCENLWQRSFVTRIDVTKAMETAIVSLFTRGEGDHCAVKCSIVFPFENVATTTAVPSNASEATSMYQVLSSYGLAGEIEIVHIVMSRGESYRKGGIMWCPLKGGNTSDVNNDVTALIRIERKFNENLDNLRFGYSPIHASGGSSPTISDLVFIEEEEHMLVLFSRLAYPMLDRVKFFSEAYAGVNQAGQAISALQGIQSNLETKLSIEISQRLQLEEALKSGAMLLGSTSSMRYSRLQLLDNVKKAIISLTASIECYIIMPNTSEVFSLIPHSMHHSADDFLDVDPNSLFTLDADRPQPVRVRLETSDLEAVALQMSKAIIAPGNNGNEGENGMKNIGQTWQSWVVRRLQGQLLMTGEDKALNMDNTFSLAVPFVLKDGTRGIASLVRRQSPYTAIDRECITWITRIFAYCMEVRGGDETVQEKTAHLTKEVERLRLADRRNASMELDTDNLERDLLISMSSNSGIAPSGYADVDTCKPELYLSHEEALQAVLLVCKNSFGNNNVHLIDTETVEPIVHKLENDKDSVETKKVKDDKDRRVTTGTIQSLNGKILYWSNYVVSLSGATSSSVKYLDVFSEGNLYLNIQQKGFPVIWIHIVLENHHLVQLRLRLIILLKLLDQLEKQSLTLRQLEDLKVSSSSKLSAQSNINRMCDYISTSTLAICNSLREEVRLTPSYGKNSSAFAQSNAWLRQSLLKLCESMSVLTSSDVGVGALSIVQSKDTSGLVTANYGVTWFTNEPEVTWAAGSGYGRQSAYPSNEPIYNIERSNPIHLAMSNKAIVFISSQSEDEAILSCAIDGITKIVNQTFISPVQKRNVKMPSIMMAPPCSGYTYGTLIIPVTIESKNSTIMIVVKPPQDKNSENAVIDTNLAHKMNAYTRSTEVISTMITSWFFLCSCIEDCVEIRENLLTLYRTEKMLGLQTLQKVVQSRKLLENGFLRFKLQSLGKKLQAAYGETSMLTLAKTQIRTQEQTLADWTEIVKGLNSAAASSVSMSGISNGVVGFWTNACRILSSLMTSYISLQSCNLYLINAEGDPIELTARELSTPNQNDGLFSPSYDYASGAIEVRMVDGLSDRIGSIVVDLLSNSSQRNKEKIIRMTRQDTEVSANMHLIEEQIWLIPVRTARAILGVLRITVQIPVINTNVSVIGAGLSNSSEYLPHHSTPRNVIRHKNDNDENSQYNNKLRLDSAQTCAINFSEVIAPLLFAAATIDKQKSNLKLNDDAHQKLLSKQKSTILELSNTVKSTSLLSNCLTALGDIMSRDPANTTNIRSLCNTIAVTIGNTIDASVTIHLHGADGDADAGVEANTKGIGSSNQHREYKTVTEALVHPITGKSLGTLSISVEVLTNTKYGLNFDVDGDVINNSFETELNTAALHIRGLENAASSSAPSASAYQFEQISAIIKSLGRILSGIIVSGSREYDSKVIVSILQDKVTQADTLEHMYSLVDFYRTVASVVNQCLVFIAETDDPHASSYKGIDGIQDRLLQFLHQLCVKLPTLLLSTNQNRTTKSLATLIGFAINADHNAASKAMNWVYADKSSKRNLRHELTDNLARSCLSTGVKSAVDIRFDEQVDDGAFNGASREKQLQYNLKSIFPDGVRVVTYPLLGHVYQETSDHSKIKVLGVMQVLLELSTSSSYTTTDIDDLLDDISHAVGCTLHEHQKRIQLYQYVSDKIICENDKLLWQEYAKSWKGISLAQASVTSNCGIMSSMAEILDVDAVQAPLVSTGLTITVKSSENPQLFVPTKSNISLDDANTTYAEISVRNPHVHNNVYESEMIDALGAIIRSGLSVCKIRTEDIHSNSKRMSKIMKENEKYKSDLRLTQLELTSLQKNYDSLKVLSSTTIASLCAPTVLELASILSNSRVNTSNIWDHVYRIADRAIERIGDNTFKYHLSVLVKEPDNSDDAHHANSMSIYSKNTSQRPILCRMYDGDRSRHGNGQTILSIATQVQTNVMKSIMMAQAPQESVVIKTFKSGDCHESVASKLTADVIGIDEQYLSSLVANAVTDGDDSSVSVSCLGITDENGDHLGMIRIVYLNESTASATTREHGSTDSTNARSLLRPVLNLVAQMTGNIISYINKRSVLVALAESRMVTIDDNNNKLIQIGALLDRARRVHTIVARECNSLLDPAILESNLSLGLSATPYRSIHPASLSPLVALQDTCMKLLNMTRTLLQSEGQAILLQDTSSTPTSYQVICTGNAITWSGVQPGIFGLVSSTTDTTSLTEVCMATQKTILVADALADLRYGSSLDGACVAGTPLLVVPLRGNGGIVMGVILIARGCTSPVYTTEDVIAAEMISSLGSIALYWAHGIKPIHSQLNQNSLQIEQLEKAVKTLSKKIKK